ncbi:hypothetical protein ACB376_23325 [Klebsiella electrica]
MKERQRFDEMAQRQGGRQKQLTAGQMSMGAYRLWPGIEAFSTTLPTACIILSLATGLGRWGSAAWGSRRWFLSSTL